MVKHRPFLIPLKEEFHMSGNHNEPENAVHTGTTTLALKCKDGVVMATDQRATMGNLIANSNVQKVYPISDYIGMTISGLVGDAQLMIRFMKSEIAIYEMEKGARISVQTAATMLGSVIRQHDFIIHILLHEDGFQCLPDFFELRMIANHQNRHRISASVIIAAHTFFLSRCS